MTILTNVSKHTCFYCNKIFSTASSLKFHIRKCSQVQKPLTEATQQSGMVVIYPSGQGIITVSEASMVEVGGVRPMAIPVITASQVAFLPGEQNVVITESS
ncbi:hypothetical protein DPMN_179666 [Dreissena polymorpha]|uniref:C2H2-type domain-containing protein n=2 Tax=Dreissena polymorpha TaxID=45954 RepID=A0A9D4ED81_DREPO|nr:hypothetical protein DPMN_179666 [Dreissena polymorpha]